MAVITSTGGFTASGEALLGDVQVSEGSWDKSIVNGVGVFSTHLAGPDNTTVYSAAIDFLSLNLFQGSLTIGILGSLSATATTNCTVTLFGAPTSGAAKISISADIYSGDIGTTVKYFAFDIATKPYPYYFLGLVSTGDNNNKEATLKIIAPCVWASSLGVQG